MYAVITGVSIVNIELCREPALIGKMALKYRRQPGVDAMPITVEIALELNARYAQSL